MHNFDKTFFKNNIALLAGVDEAGRGPLAGPVVCASVIMPLFEEEIIKNVNDSKKLSPKVREELYEKIVNKAVDYCVVFIDQEQIDKVNILNATKQGMKGAIDGLMVKPDMVLVDAVQVEASLPTTPIIKGDEKSYLIACASILAKVERDRYMRNLAKEYPNYGFEKHKGYGTKLHINKIKEHGPCVAHRKSFLKKIV